MSEDALQVVKSQQATYRVHKHHANLFPFEERITTFKFFHITTWSLQLLHILANLALVVHAQHNGLVSSWKLWIGLFAHFFLTVPEASAAFDIMLGLLSSKASNARPSYDLQGPEAPSVDIMITCCGEPNRIIINTVEAATVQVYPSNRYRIFVLDDADDPELRHAVEMSRSRAEARHGPTIQYLSREKEEGAKSYFKSGNLRSGIEASRLSGGLQFIAGLDADMIIEPQWLRRLVPHLLLNDNVALVCGPQVSAKSTRPRKSYAFTAFLDDSWMR